MYNAQLASGLMCQELDKKVKDVCRAAVSRLLMSTDAGEWVGFYLNDNSLRSSSRTISLRAHRHYVRWLIELLREISRGMKLFAPALMRLELYILHVCAAFHPIRAIAPVIAISDFCRRWQTSLFK